ncbi:MULTISPECIES: hypothetical protein [Streptomyces violaceusniger group]|uniref:Uncharacterized protein n=2 Tax=Streptomyces javensis TaxID=114698 RepID=A0ABS0RKB8_9ACTN|nr:hypothetical protein [Streptomyces javensis]MBI0317884.1 hypothetical protein [Streptomyces javensis]
MGDQARWLLIVERAYRGSIETQYADALYCVPDLHRQSGGCDLALRGHAAGYALDSGSRPALRLGDRTLDTLPHPPTSVARLLAAGVTVLVEEDGLAALGRTAAERLLPGVRVIRGDDLAARWPSYEQVWFL